MTRPGQPPIVAALERALSRLVPERAALRAWTGTGVPGLMAGEHIAVDRAVERRRNEFARGRATARDALVAIGGPASAIPVGSAGEPIWPPGYVGSISHCEGLIAAVAIGGATGCSVGLDIEPAKPLPEETRDLVLAEGEQASLDDPLLETVVFSVKESVHKAIFPVQGLWLDFTDVMVTLERRGASDGVRSGDATFRAALGARVRTELLAVLEGRWVVGPSFVGTFCYLPPPGSLPTSS